MKNIRYIVAAALLLGVGSTLGAALKNISGNEEFRLRKELVANMNELTQDASRKPIVSSSTNLTQLLVGTVVLIATTNEVTFSPEFLGGTAPNVFFSYKSSNFSAATNSARSTLVTTNGFTVHGGLTTGEVFWTAIGLK